MCSDALVVHGPHTWGKDEDEVAQWWQMLAGAIRKARPDPAVPLLLFVDSNLPVGDVLSAGCGMCHMMHAMCCL